MSPGAGVKCDSICEPGRWGEDCQAECDCKAGNQASCECMADNQAEFDCMAGNQVNCD